MGFRLGTRSRGSGDGVRGGWKAGIGVCLRSASLFWRDRSGQMQGDVAMNLCYATDMAFIIAWVGLGSHSRSSGLGQSDWIAAHLSSRAHRFVDVIICTTDT